MAPVVPSETSPDTAEVTGRQTPLLQRTQALNDGLQQPVMELCVLRVVKPFWSSVCSSVEWGNPVIYLLGYFEDYVDQHCQVYQILSGEFSSSVPALSLLWVLGVAPAGSLVAT